MESHLKHVEIQNGWVTFMLSDPTSSRQFEVRWIYGYNLQKWQFIFVSACVDDAWDEICTTTIYSYCRLLTALFFIVSSLLRLCSKINNVLFFCSREPLLHKIMTYFFCGLFYCLFGLSVSSVRLCVNVDLKKKICLRGVVNNLYE